MPILEDDVLWAKNLQFDNTTGRPNREQIPLELLYSGLLRNQALPRPFMNQILYQQGQATLTVQSDYIAADNILQSNIDAEALARSNADDTLQSNLDAEISNRISADDLLQSNLDTETNDRVSADNTLQNNINTEKDERTLADNNLQSQIDSLTQAILQQIMPVGYMYVTKNTTNPSTQLGFGVWSLIEGRTLVGYSETDASFDAIGKEGGSKLHSHTDSFSVDGHSLTELEIPSHAHALPEGGVNYAVYGTTTDTNTRVENFNSDTTSPSRSLTKTAGGGDPHTHGLSGSINDSSSLQPYHVVYIWERTA